MTGQSVVLLILALLSPMGAEQLPTIPEILSTEGASKRVNMVPSGEMPPLDSVLKQADLAVRATVADASPFLSEDQHDVYTAYRLTNVRVIYRRPLERPAVLPDLTVAIRGGAISIDDKTFVQEEQAFPPLTPGTVGVFLLVRKGDRYRLAGAGIGAFIVTNERLRPFARVKGFAVELGSLPTAAAEAHLADRARALRP